MCATRGIGRVPSSIVMGPELGGGLWVSRVSSDGLVSLSSRRKSSKSARSALELNVCGLSGSWEACSWNGRVGLVVVER